MPRKIRALALCRVSSIEQLQNNSLNRQRSSVLRAAKELNVEIPEDGWWSGSVSSKRGTNVEREDLRQIIERCKKDKSIKFLIVDEPDRFMRSIDESSYFEVVLRGLGVTVWYASDAQLNKGDLSSKLLKFTKYLSAEGSNEERQHKSITGQVKALQEGRFPFAPKPGYKRGYERGIQEIHPIRGPILRDVLISIVLKKSTPSQALVELNKSKFVEGRAEYKMDKFRKIITDPFYAGIVEINKQVVFRNENGLHASLISKEQHNELVRIMGNKEKNQTGPRKNGNPKYPGNNIITCASCRDKRNGRFVGFDHSNGKNKSRIYERYRCRACGLYLSRDDVHSGIEKQFKDNPITDQGIEYLIEALDQVWKQKEVQVEQEVRRIELRINNLQESINSQVEAATDPSNISIKEDILQAIERKKSEIIELEDNKSQLQIKADADKERFLRFAFNFADTMGSRFLDGSLSQENRSRCKQILFPGGFYINKSKKVYTPQKSPLITLLANKKDLPKSEKSFMVRVKRL